MRPEVRRAVEHAENFDRTHLNWRERGVWREASMEANRRMYPSWTQNDEADASGVSQKQVSRELKIGKALKVAPELLEDCRTQEEAEKVLDNLEERVALVKAKEKVPDKVKNAPKGASDHFRIGDAVEKMQLEPDESVDFAEVDPPYGVKLDIHKKGTANIETYTEWSEKEYEERLPIVAREVYRLLKNDSYAVFWYGTKHHCLTLRILKEAGFKIDPIPCIWVKGKVEDVLKSGYAAAPNYNFATCYETFFMVRKGSAMLPLNDGRGHGRGRSNVFHSPPDPGKNHATGKPLGLMLDVLQSIVRIPGSTVHVPFLGSGVTLRAAYQLGHTGFGWDLSEEHRE
jgi:site-specific DNA-methyltransferase (adenine-specific)